MPATREQQLESLRQAVNAGDIAARDAEFASSLVASYDRRERQLSESQWLWVGRLLEGIARVQAAEQAISATQGTFRPVTQAIARAFARGINRPIIRLRTPDGVLIRLTRAGSASRYVGQVYIAWRNWSGEYVYQGRIDLEGTFHASQRNNLRQDVYQAVQAWAANPSEASGRYGRDTGQCCFCGRSLTDERSVSVGYGPVCAERYGLPWGGHEAPAAAPAPAAARPAPQQPTRRAMGEFDEELRYS